MKGEMDALDARKAELTSQLANIPEDVPDILPTASAIYANESRGASRSPAHGQSPRW